MALSDKLVGKHFRYPDYYVVEREKVREYARAVKAIDAASFSEEAAADLGRPGLIPNLTFLAGFAYQAIVAFFEYAGVNHSDAQVVQVDQVLKFMAPANIGDKLYCDVSIESIRQAHGTDIITTKQVFTNQSGETVQETYTTLAGRSGDGEEGFSDGSA